MYKAAVLNSPQHLSMEQRRIPQVGDKEALIRVSMAGICGTDIAIYSGNYRVSLPLVLGHELVGKVVEVGSGVSSELVGKLVTAEINNTCVSYGSENPCAACNRGLPNHCLRRTVLGIIDCDGAFAELVKVPANNIHLLPLSISLEEAIFVEPLAAAIQTFELTEVRPRDTVVVLGAGRLGILTIAVAGILGARVVAVSRSAEKLERALRYGASFTINASSEDVVSRVMASTEGMGADIIVEATGSTDAIGVALDMVKPRGTIAMKTTSGIPTPNIDTTRLVVNEIRVQGSRCGPFDKAIDLLEGGQIDVKPLVAAVHPLDELAKAIVEATRLSKVLIDLS